jgi:4-aminobutyrate aminotransferase / (S)-3-amino-2-methylpropionate transaminase / 5-aminovalerate transaminase
MLEDVDGNRFIDWTSGVLATNLGHSHPRVVEAMQKACENLVNVYEYCTEYRVRAAEKLVKVAPEGLDRCFFLTAGSEAVDSAVRIMRRASGRFEMVTFYGAFHGRTLSTGSLGGLKKVKCGFGPSMPGVIRVPYPYCYRCPFHSKPSKCGFLCIEFIQTAITANSTGSLAGVLIEPYLGTAGFIFPPDGWLKMLERWIREKNLFFAVDEIQSSFGRTGTLWASEREGIKPDIIMIGKGLANGFPASALLMKQELVEQALTKGELGSTYGGNPVACAAISAVLDVFQEENILDRVSVISGIFVKELPKLMEVSPYVGDIRGKGMVWGIEIVENRKTKIPSGKIARQLVHLCAQKGLLIGLVGEYGNVIRVGPPLVINEEQTVESIGILRQSFNEL